MSNVIGIPSTRVSDLFVRQLLLTQVQQDQVDLVRLEAQLSTGQRINAPSEDPIAASRIISIQRLLEQKTQVRANIQTNQSFLTSTDAALGTVSNLMAETRGAALAVLGTTASDTQRQAAAEQVRQALSQLVSSGNQSLGGRYLFSGTDTGLRPFEIQGNAAVKYLGNEGQLDSYGDIDQLFNTNLNGQQAFGAISDPVHGTADCNPILTVDTPLTSLRSGQAVKPGSIEISNGAATSIIDLSSAKTIGDVAAMIQAKPPQGSAVTAEVTARGLEIWLDAGNLSIKDVGSGTTARELGILRKSGAGPGPLVGEDLDPVLRLTTRLADLFGVRASAVVRSAGGDNDFIVEADHNTDTLNGVTVSLFDDGTVQQAGQEVAHYDSTTKTLQVNIRSGVTQAHDVVDAINRIYNPDDPLGSTFQARLDPLDDVHSGRNLVDVHASAVTRYGSGFDFDQQSGLQIVNGDQTHTITFSQADGVNTVEDLLNTLNGSAADVLASLNESRTGIDIRSRLSGTDFAIGENGGTTATELGLRTLTADTRLEDIQHGKGVSDYTGLGTQATVSRPSVGANNDLVFRARNDGPQWNDFQISFVEKVPAGPDTLTYDAAAKTMVFAINPGVTTANDVIALVNQTAGAKDDFEIALDNADGLPNDGSGLVSASTAAKVTKSWAGTSNDLLFQARNSGPDWNDFAISFVAGDPPGTTGLNYDRDAKTMTFQVDPGVTTANDLLLLFQGDPDAMADFSMTVAPQDGSPNLGNGPVWPDGDVQTAGGATVDTQATVGGTSGGADFTITRKDGASFEIDIQGAKTIGDVLDLINTNPTNLAPGGRPVVARLAASGNGIELVDDDPSGGTLTVARTQFSTAAIDLGLIAEGNVSATTSRSGAAASATLRFATINSGLLVQSLRQGTLDNGVMVRMADMAEPGGPGVPSYHYDAVQRTLTFWINPGATTANQVIALFNQNPPIDPAARAIVTVGLDQTVSNNGTGKVQVKNTAMSGGLPDLLTGRDVDPQETEGLFTALVRLYQGLKANDTVEVQRSMDMLDRGVVNMNFSRAELAARQQGLDALTNRLDDEHVQLQKSLSDEFDADMVQTVSDLTARQVAYDASLKATAQIYKMTLLNYL